MSQRLCIRKENQDLISFGRSSEVYQAFQLPYSDNWKELEQIDFDFAIKELQQKEEYREEEIKLHKKALEGLSYEDKLECLRDIKAIQEELKDIVQAKHWIELLQMIDEEFYENNKEQTMYYRID